MPLTEGNTGCQVVAWTSVPDRDADRVRLVVLHLAAGVFVLVGLGVLVLLAVVVTDGLVAKNFGATVLVVVLALIGGPASLLYLLLTVKYGSEYEVQELAPSVDWFRLRYTPVSLLGGGILLLSLAVQPELLLVYLVGLVVCKIAIDLRYSVGRIHGETATLQQVSGAAAAEYIDEGELDTNDRRVRTFDLSPLKNVHQQQIGRYTVFVPRYQSRGRWGRPLVLVVPNDAATDVESALGTVIRTTDWTPRDKFDRPVRIALGGLGVLFLGATGGLVAVGTDAFPIVVYAGVTLGLLGGAMLFLAVRG